MSEKVRLDASDIALWPPVMLTSTAARYLDTTPRTLQRLVAAGEIAVAYRVGVRPYFNRRDLDHWREARTAATRRERERADDAMKRKIRAATGGR